MFKAFIKNEYGECIKEMEDCINIQVLSEHDMEIKHPDILEMQGISSPYMILVDSQGRHFYPLYVYSVEIG